VGTWATEATHPEMPGVVVRGTTAVEWLEGEHFLMLRAHSDHPDFPDFIAMIGHTEHGRADEATGQAPASSGESPLHMHYFDSRGVFRDYGTRMDAGTWRIWRDDPGFSQRFAGTLSEDGGSIDGRWQVCRDGVHWADDVAITYRRTHDHERK
jgi:hypothetical protein